MTMAHGLEARVPFLDHELVTFVASVPPHLKLGRFLTKKYLLKCSLTGRLPRKILARQKQGFNVPKGAWLKGQMRSFALDMLSPQTMREIGWFNPVGVTRLLEDHWANRQDNSHRIWGLLVLTLWWQQFIKSDGSGS
jgi:asparagine synthase (glutamine-hydrolysing)